MGRELTSNELLELIVDIAEEQAMREISGMDWLHSLLDKISKKQNHKEGR